MLNLSTILTPLTICCALVGCRPPTDDAHNHTHSGADGHAHTDAHAHGETGPHGGHLIELGRSHEFHAELVEDESHESLTIYLLDHALKEFAIDQATINLVVTAGGETTTLELSGQASHADAGFATFTSKDPALKNLLAGEGDITAKLRVTIDGKPYTGTWEHHAH